MTRIQWRNEKMIINITKKNCWYYYDLLQAAFVQNRLVFQVSSQEPWRHPLFSQMGMGYLLRVRIIIARRNYILFRPTFLIDCLENNEIVLVFFFEYLFTEIIKKILSKFVSDIVRVTWRLDRLLLQQQTQFIWQQENTPKKNNILIPSWSWIHMPTFV